MGLNWRIFVAMPEKRYIDQISDSTRDTLSTILVILIQVNLLGVATTRILTNSITQLTNAADQMSRGDLEQMIPSHPIT